jgi:aromatic-L-amino-acid/L-tryptophan decarboxylase
MSDPLELDAETMRQMGYQVVDYLVDRISNLRDQPVRRGITRNDIDALLKEPAPETAHALDELLGRLQKDVFQFGVKVDHPRFMAFVPGSATWPGVLGDTIAAAHQSFAGTWLGGAGVSALELVVIDWFRSWLGMPATASGLLLSGGSMANLTAIAAARIDKLGEQWDHATIYMSRESHSSLLRACRVLGFRRDRIRVIDVDADHRISIPELQRIIRDDVAAGLEPFCVVANAGTTSTGAVDPLNPIRELAADLDLWFHVDAAYGGFAVLTERGRDLLKGIERADSITLDPHKWLHQPFEAGCLMVKDPEALKRAYHILPDYMQDTAVNGAEINFGERGIQLTRAARAVKIWLSIQYFGLEAFRSAINTAIDLTLEAQHYIEQSDALQLITPARLGIVCFRRKGSDHFNEQLQKQLIDDGLAMISSTRVHGNFALRLCILNHRTTRDDVMSVLEWIEKFEA